MVLGKQEWVKEGLWPDRRAEGTGKWVTQRIFEQKSDKLKFVC